MTGQKKKTKLAKQFSEARTMVGKGPVEKIPRGAVIQKINDAIGWNFGGPGYRALEDIKWALAFISGATGGRMNMEIIDNASHSSAIERAIELEVIYNCWSARLCREGKIKARDATQMFAKGEGPREIEAKVRVARGQGMATNLIIQGIGEYLKAKIECEAVVDRMREIT